MIRTDDTLVANIAATQQLGARGEGVGAATTPRLGQRDKTR